MQILYGVAGEGFGHSSRSKEIISHLQKQGHKVKIITYAQGYDVLSKNFNVIKVKGLHLFFKNNSLDIIKTIAYNTANFPKNILKLKKFKNLVRDFKPNLCISDMEAIVPIISNIYKIPLLSIDNQHRITNAEIEVPLKFRNDYIIAKEVIDKFAKKAGAFIVLSFSKLKITKKNTFLVSPVIRKEVLKLKPRSGKKILVYINYSLASNAEMTKKESYIVDIIKKLNEKFIVYGFNKNEKSNNIVFKSFGPHFLKDLAECKAIIATSGFSLISEALYLKKPYLAVPLQGQFEQILNAIVLKKSGFGNYTLNLTEKDINDFFKKIKTYKKNLKNYKTNPNEIFEVLNKVMDTITQK